MKAFIILGNDLSGVVVEVGASVHRFKVGDEVYARVDKDRNGRSSVHPAGQALGRFRGDDDEHG